LLTPHWLGLHALTVLLVIIMAWLGWWQLGRAQAPARLPAQTDSAPAPLDDLTSPRRSLPGDAVGRVATASGAYDGGRQLLVAGREQAGRPGFWLLTPLRLADGTALAVVRGWVSSPADPAATVPSGQVRVTGRLQPSEPPGPPDVEQPAGQVSTVTTAELVSVLPYPLYDGYLLLAEQSPASQAAPVAPPAPSPGRLDLQNFAYAVQWWVFALFTIFIWWRLMRDPRRDIVADKPAVEDRGVTA
jgi:cytochrome oxidase assembly protein ShyY1